MIPSQNMTNKYFALEIGHQCLCQCLLHNHAFLLIEMLGKRQKDWSVANSQLLGLSFTMICPAYVPQSLVCI